MGWMALQENKRALCDLKKTFEECHENTSEHYVTDFQRTMT